MHIISDHPVIPTPPKLKMSPLITHDWSTTFNLFDPGNFSGAKPLNFGSKRWQKTSGLHLLGALESQNHPTPQHYENKAESGHHTGSTLRQHSAGSQEVMPCHRLSYVGRSCIPQFKCVISVGHQWRWRPRIFWTQPYVAKWHSAQIQENLVTSLGPSSIHDSSPSQWAASLTPQLPIDYTFCRNHADIKYVKYVATNSPRPQIHHFVFIDWTKKGQKGRFFKDLFRQDTCQNHHLSQTSEF